MSNITKTVVVALSLLTVTSASAATIQGPTVTADFAKDALPPCGRASMAIFNGAAFDGVVYLHNKDLAFDGSVIQVVRAIAAQGEIPALCQVNGLTFVTLASR